MDDISITSDHVWYDWIKLYDPISKQFPEEKIYPGWYLGPTIYVCPALTAHF